MAKPVQASIVDFHNSGDQPLQISVIVNGAEHHVATLMPGETIRQVTPGLVEWRFSNAAGAGSGDDGGDGIDVASALSKGEKGAKGENDE